MRGWSGSLVRRWSQDSSTSSTHETFISRHFTSAKALTESLRSAVGTLLDAPEISKLLDPRTLTRLRREAVHGSPGAAARGFVALLQDEEKRESSELQQRTLEFIRSKPWLTHCLRDPPSTPSPAYDAPAWSPFSDRPPAYEFRVRAHHSPAHGEEHTRCHLIEQTVWHWGGWAAWTGFHTSPPPSSATSAASSPRSSPSSRRSRSSSNDEDSDEEEGEEEERIDSYVLQLGASGSSGTLRFVRNNGAYFLFAMGVHDGEPWVDAVADLHLHRSAVEMSPTSVHRGGGCHAGGVGEGKVGRDRGEGAVKKREARKWDREGNELSVRVVGEGPCYVVELYV